MTVGKSRFPVVDSVGSFLILCVELKFEEIFFVNTENFCLIRLERKNFVDGLRFGLLLRSLAPTSASPPLLWLVGLHSVSVDRTWLNLSLLTLLAEIHRGRCSLPTCQTCQWFSLGRWWMRCQTPVLNSSAILRTFPLTPGTSIQLQTRSREVDTLS